MTNIRIKNRLSEIDIVSKFILTDELLFYFF